MNRLSVRLGILLCAGTFSSNFQDVLNHEGYVIEGETVPAPGFTDVTTTVQGSNGPVSLLFRMKLKDVGRNTGCWMTSCLTRASS
jgi:hypothetical protein